MQPAIVIVGAGQAGVAAAMGLRERGWHGKVTLIGDEPHLPYERPPLSKSILSADDPVPPKIIHTAQVLREYGIDHIARCAVTAIDREAHTVRIEDGREIAYVRLLLTTGAKARRLPLAIPGSGNAVTLRTFEDALSLRSMMMRGSRLAIIGGGFIGLEVAACAVRRGAAVTLVELAPRVLMRGVPEPIAQLIDRQHRLAGVNVLTSARLNAIHRGANGIEVRLQDDTFQADCVIAGIGAVPNTALAEATGLAIENGIAVDEHLLTSDPDIFAAGDCCSFPHDLYGGRRVRLESWRSTCEQGAIAAANMLGGKHRYCAVPWFWSDHYDRTLQVAGLAEDGMTEVERPLPEGGLLVHGLAKDGRVLCASAFGRLKHVAKEIRTAQTLIAHRSSLAADPTVRSVAAQL